MTYKAQDQIILRVIIMGFEVLEPIQCGGADLYC